MSAYPEGEFVLPLFPLPNLVFFPSTRLPLHIFEPRYRQMVADALESDQRFGIVLLRPGWEPHYYGRPPIHTHGTIGRIEQAVPLDDGRYNILVHGDVRFRIVGEMPSEPYRKARVVPTPEVQVSVPEAYAQREWLADLSRQYITYLPEQSEVPEIDVVGLDALTNALIMSLNLEVEEKQKLLETDDVIGRAEKIGTELQNRIESLKFLAPWRKQTDPSKN